VDKSLFKNQNRAPREGTRPTASRRNSITL
jgi:hypothetical protein